MYIFYNKIFNVSNDLNKVHYFVSKWTEMWESFLVGCHTSSKYGIRCNFLSSPKSILVPWSLVRQSPSFDWFSHCSPKTSNCNYSEVIFSTSLHNCIMYCIWYHSLCTIIRRSLSIFGCLMKWDLLNKDMTKRGFRLKGYQLLKKNSHRKSRFFSWKLSSFYFKNFI